MSRRKKFRAWLAGWYWQLVVAPVENFEEKIRGKR